MLGRHVRRRAHDHAGVGQVGGIDAGDPEVCNLERAVAGEDQVRGFHVAVHDTALVREVQRQQQLRHDGGDLSEIEARLPVEVFAQARAFDVLHRDERVECVLAVFINADDVRMQQPSGRLRLVLEARHHLHGKIGIDEILAYGLDRNDALDVRIEGLVHNPHRALAEYALD